MKRVIARRKTAVRKQPERIWLFDLDNTLHHASPFIFPAINANMNRFIASVLADRGLVSDEAAVNAARIHYWKKYGATLSGMMLHHGVKAADFLQAAHTFDDLPSMVVAAAGLRQVLRALPGKKILLTNAQGKYSQEVVRLLGLGPLIRHQISVESMRVHGRIRPKPSLPMLRGLVRRHGWRPRDCVLVEDTVANLRTAHRLGMKTVWVTGYASQTHMSGPLGALKGELARSKRPRYIDLRVHSVGNLLRRQIP